MKHIALFVSISALFFAGCNNNQTKNNNNSAIDSIATINNSVKKNSTSIIPDPPRNPKLDLLDSRNGFRDVKLGSNISNYSDMIKEPYGTYRRANDNLQVSDYSAERIDYYCYKEIVYKIELEFQISYIDAGRMVIEEDEKNNIFKSLVIQYGNPTDTIQSEGQIQWKGKKVWLCFENSNTIKDIPEFNYHGLMPTITISYINPYYQRKLEIEDSVEQYRDSIEEQKRAEQDLHKPGF